MFGKDYFMPHLAVNDNAANRAKCLEIKAHPVAIQSKDDADAVRTVAKMCELMLFLKLFYHKYLYL